MFSYITQNPLLLVRAFSFSKVLSLKTNTSISFFLDRLHRQISLFQSLMFLHVANLPLTGFSILIYLILARYIDDNQALP